MIPGAHDSRPTVATFKGDGITGTVKGDMMCAGCASMIEVTETEPVILPPLIRTFDPSSGQVDLFIGTMHRRCLSNWLEIVGKVAPWAMP